MRRREDEVLPHVPWARLDLRAPVHFSVRSIAFIAAVFVGSEGLYALLIYLQTHNSYIWNPVVLLRAAGVLLIAVGLIVMATAWFRERVNPIMHPVLWCVIGFPTAWIASHVGKRFMFPEFATARDGFLVGKGWLAYAAFYAAGIAVLALIGLLMGLSWRRHLGSVDQDIRRELASM